MNSEPNSIGKLCVKGIPVHVGSAFAVSRWHALTTFHCLEAAFGGNAHPTQEEVEQRGISWKPPGREGFAIKAIKADRVRDIALLTFAKPLPMEIQPLVPSTDLKAGTDFRCAGFPISNPNISITTILGRVSWLEAELWGSKVFQISSMEAGDGLRLQGMSGSPILARSPNDMSAEKVIGILRWSEVSQDFHNKSEGGIAFAVAISEVFDFAPELRQLEISHSPRTMTSIPGVPKYLDFDEPTLQLEEIEWKLLSGRFGGIVLEGMPGIGKSAMAAKIGSRLRARKDLDYVFWVSLGKVNESQSPKSFHSVFLDWLKRAKAALSEKEGMNAKQRLEILPLSEEERRDPKGHLEALLAGKRCVIIIDDVWQLGHIKSLQTNLPDCRYLVSTRFPKIAKEFVRNESNNDLGAIISLKPWSPERSLRLVQRLAPEAFALDPDSISHLVNACEGIPILLNVLGSYLSSSHAASFKRLHARRLREFANPSARIRMAVDRFGSEPGIRLTMENLLDLTLSQWTEESGTRRAFNALGAFEAKPARFSLDAALAVICQGVGVGDGEFGDEDGEAALENLVNSSLLEVSEDEGQWLTMHQIWASIAAQRTPPEAISAFNGFYLKLIESDPLDVWIVEKHLPQVRRSWQESPDSSTFLRWMSSLQTFVRCLGLWGEFSEVTERFLSKSSGTISPEAHGALLANLATSRFHTHGPEASTDLYQKALPQLARAGDWVGYGYVLKNLADSHRELGDSESSLGYAFDAHLLLGLLRDKAAESIGEEFFSDTEAEGLKKLDLSRIDRIGKIKAIFEASGKVLEGKTGVIELNSWFWKEVRNKGMLLLVLDSFVHRKDTPADFEGAITIGAENPLTGRLEYWKGEFQLGKAPVTSFSKDMPEAFDVFLLLQGMNSLRIIMKGKVSQPDKLRLQGDVSLLKKFIKSYLEPSSEGTNPNHEEYLAAVKTLRAGINFYKSNLPQIGSAYLDDAAARLGKLAETKHPEYVTTHLFCANLKEKLSKFEVRQGSGGEEGAPRPMQDST